MAETAQKEERIMELFQIIVLVMTGIFAAITVLVRNALRQTILLSFYGLILGILFLALQAPEVALSEIVVGSFIIPLIILLTLAKIRAYLLEQRKERNK
jgi:uncharacterized MnhB-related membrane protein